MNTTQILSVSVSLRSIIHSYVETHDGLWHLYYIPKFPSPYGVSFILILIITLLVAGYCYGFRLLTEYHSFLSVYYDRVIIIYRFLKFPSPYGVSFILIFDIPASMQRCFHIVSVSLRSIIHSYLNPFSYVYTVGASFRLLTEYHSFL